MIAAPSLAAGPGLGARAVWEMTMIDNMSRHAHLPTLASVPTGSQTLHKAVRKLC